MAHTADPKHKSGQAELNYNSMKIWTWDEEMGSNIYQHDNQDNRGLVVYLLVENGWMLTIFSSLKLLINNVELHLWHIP